MPPGDYDDDIKAAMRSESTQNAKALRRVRDRTVKRSLLAASLEPQEEYNANETRNAIELERFRRSKRQTGEYE